MHDICINEFGLNISDTISMGNWISIPCMILTNKQYKKLSIDRISRKYLSTFKITGCNGSNYTVIYTIPNDQTTLETTNIQFDIDNYDSINITVSSAGRCCVAHGIKFTK